MIEQEELLFILSNAFEKSKTIFVYFYDYCKISINLIHMLHNSAMRASEDRSGPFVTCPGNPCQSTGTSSRVSTGDLPVLPVQVTNVPDRSSGFLISSVLI